jgi:large subunit ribosomal protein L18
MSTDSQKKVALRNRRSWRVRKRFTNRPTKPRLAVYKSNKHIQVQIIDSETGETLGGTATYAKEFRDTEFGRKSKKAAKKLGERIAEIAKKKNIEEVVFDRGPFKYHGILAELADAARSSGLKF